MPGRVWEPDNRATATGLLLHNGALDLRHGDCLPLMAAMPAASVDSIVTDPPYGLGFMGKAWDDLPPGVEWAQACLRVLKPGGYLLAFGGSRTWHRLACAVEDAGFEIRDSIAWLYGSGFPKSLDVSKAIDKAAGAEREVVGAYVGPDGKARPNSITDADFRSRAYQEKQGYRPEGAAYPGEALNGTPREITAPATDAARDWAGWGTALKPAFEPIVVARKPLAGTVAQNVLTHGTGALNIDACRVEAGSNPHVGRWPANVVLDGSQADALDQQTGILTSGTVQPHTGHGSGRSGGIMGTPVERVRPFTQGDSGGASRFFPTFRYQAKAPSRERPRSDDGIAHPTVKPLDLMRWLVRLVTPPGGLVLDPFLGSGTTAEAALIEGFRCIGIEREAAYLDLAVIRCSKPLAQVVA